MASIDTFVEYDKLNRQLPTLLKNNAGKVPKLYIKTVADLEILVQETVDKQKVTPKKMNALATRGLNAVRQKIRKLNKDYESDINTYREDKDGYMEEDEEVAVTAPARKTKTKDVFARGEDADEGDDEGWEGVGKDGRAVKYSPESILKNLRSIIESRGRKNTDRIDQIRIMERLLDVAATDYQRIRVLLTVISTRFDLTSNTGNFMAQEQWRM